MKQQFHYLREQSKGFRVSLLVGLTLGVLNIALGLVFIYVSKEIVDIVTGKSEGDLWTYVGYLAVMLVLRLAVSSTRQWVNGRTAQRLVNALRRRLFDIVLNSPWHGRETLKSGDVMTRISEDLRVVVACIINDIPAVIISFFQLLAASWFLFSLQPKLLLLLVLILPFALALSKLYYKTTRRLTKQIRSEEAGILSHIQESVQNRPLLLSLHRTDLMSDRMQKQQENLFGTYTRRLKFSIRTRLLIQSGFSVGYYTTFVWSAYGLMTGSVTYGMMTALLQLVAQVQNPILDLSSLFPAIVQATTAVDRLKELESEAGRPVSNPPLASRQEEHQSIGPRGLRLSNVSYRYPDGEEDVLHDFSCEFLPGTSTAILGPTGSGKSTLVRLLLGLLKPNAGSIELLNPDGSVCGEPDDLNAALGNKDKRSDLCYVPQGNSLLSGTIRDNLLLGNLEATEDEMYDALRRASALFVYALPQGLDSPCGEKGSGLSEGQAQRIAIARALLQPGSILILDEASSALDPDTERQILEDLQRQDLGKTLIWVTHHLVVREFMQNCLRVD